MTITLTLVKIESMFHTHRAVPILKADKDTSLQELAVLVMTVEIQFHIHHTVFVYLFHSSI